MAFINGTNRNDWLRGTSREDTINGRDGNDTIILGDLDTGIGGAGRDRFVIASGVDATVDEFDLVRDVLDVSQPGRWEVTDFGGVDYGSIAGVTYADMNDMWFKLSGPGGTEVKLTNVDNDFGFFENRAQAEHLLSKAIDYGWIDLA